MNEQNKKVPTVRFKGFTNDWEQHKLRKVACINPKTNIPDNFKYVDLESVVGTSLIKAKLTTKQLAPSRAQRVAKKGDIFYQTVRPYQKNNFLFDINNYDFQYVFSTGYAQLRSEINNYFLFSYLQRQRFVNLILRRSTGTSYPAISSKDLSEIKIIFPRNSKEQENIGKIINLIDALITLQQRKLDLLKQLKKGLLQKMFADKDSKRPILRFEGFTGNWEIRQLKELGEIITGNTPKTSQVENYSSNGIPWVTPTDINSVYTTDSAKRLSTVGKDKAKIAPANSLLVTCIASIGKNTLILQESAFNQQINALIPVKNDPFFLLAESAKWSRIMRNLAGQTSMQIINKKTFSGISTSIPDLKEQKIIGSLFKKLDNTIAFQQQRISRVNEIKKSLLQQMFI